MLLVIILTGYKLYGTALPQLEEESHPRESHQLQKSCTIIQHDNPEPSKPKVLTEIPGPRSKELIRKLNQYQVVLKNYNMFYQVTIGVLVSTC